ncbi:unnamed protein product [Gongylonema pulchrum]|uniref:Cytochrome P450 n=1 Tax=Gongylonema pulchrum TaxID=637853 RepID=A0A183CW17_9BILA|nr:unnamed protein product [Gongylonema pulchrum]
MGVSINAQMGENQDFYIAITRIFELLFKNLRYPWLWVKPIWYALGYGAEYDKHVDIVRSLVVKVSAFQWPDECRHSLPSLMVGPQSCDVMKVIEERKREFENMENEPTFEELSTSARKLAFLDLLLSMRKEHKLTDDDIMEEVGTFMVAGFRNLCYLNLCE